MNIYRAGKQTKAFWRAEEKWAEKAAADPMLVVPSNTPHHFDVERRRSFAAGWIAGVNYLRRQRGANIAGLPRAGNAATPTPST